MSIEEMSGPEKFASEFDFDSVRPVVKSIADILGPEGFMKLTSRIAGNCLESPACNPHLAWRFALDSSDHHCSSSREHFTRLRESNLSYGFYNYLSLYVRQALMEKREGCIALIGRCDDSLNKMSNPVRSVAYWVEKQNLLEELLFALCENEDYGLDVLKCLGLDILEKMIRFALSTIDFRATWSSVRERTGSSAEGFRTLAQLILNLRMVYDIRRDGLDADCVRSESFRLVACTPLFEFVDCFKLLRESRRMLLELKESDASSDVDFSSVGNLEKEWIAKSVFNLVDYLSSTVTHACSDAYSSLKTCMASYRVSNDIMGGYDGLYNYAFGRLSVLLQVSRLTSRLWSLYEPFDDDLRRLHYDRHIASMSPQLHVPVYIDLDTVLDNKYFDVESDAPEKKHLPDELQFGLCWYMGDSMFAGVPNLSIRDYLSGTPMKMENHLSVDRVMGLIEREKDAIYADYLCSGFASLWSRC